MECRETRELGVRERKERRAIGVAVAAVLLLRSVALAAEGSSATAFVVPPELRPQVNFWRDVFATYSERQVVIHDTERLDRIYGVLDFRSSPDGEGTPLRQVMRARVEEEIERIRAQLYRLHQMGPHPTELTAEEQRIWKMFEPDPDPQKLLKATAEDRIRDQAGLRERFARGIEAGHRYFPEMERIFRSEGVPPEVTRLTLVESCFNVHAYSKVGAAGIWQFMPATGRRFMRIDDVVDERRDPIESTRAAARFLRENYERLGSWPLAINAYNHGPAGLARAVNELGTRDIVSIIQDYRGPAFKFASRNFYPEFLAALEVERNHRRYFGPLRLERPVPTDSVRLARPVGISTAAACAGVDVGVIAELNPSLSGSIVYGKRPIPSGFPLRMPAEATSRFEREYAAVAATAVAKGRSSASRRAGVAPAKKPIVHRVRRGQTLDAIARHYGSTVGRILQHNKIRNARVREGQVLRIPTG